MTEQSFHVGADVSSADPAAIQPVLREHMQGQITRLADGFHIDADMVGASARDLNRMLLPALRLAAPNTRLRSEWTSAGVTHWSLMTSRGERPPAQILAPGAMSPRGSEPWTPVGTPAWRLTRNSPSSPPWRRLSLPGRAPDTERSPSAA